MKALGILLAATIGLTAYGADRMGDAELEARARAAVQLSYDNAVVAGNAWHQQIFEHVGALIGIHVDEANGRATIMLQGGEQCLLEVELDLYQGYVEAPVSFACPEF